MTLASHLWNTTTVPLWAAIAAGVVWIIAAAIWRHYRRPW